MHPAITRFRIVLLTATLVTLFTAVGALCLGVVPIPLPSVLSTLLHPHTAPPDYSTILWQIRIPRILLAALVGAALASSGAGFQSLLRNDLADPYILGISSGASAAVAGVTFLSYAIGSSLYVNAAAGFIGSVVTLLVVVALSTRNLRIDSRSLLLNGIIFSAFLWALEMAALQFAGYNREQILNWLMGSLASASWPAVLFIGTVTAICLVTLWLLSPGMNLYSIGEESAKQLGLDAERFKLVLAIASTLLAAAAVSCVGIIGFIGLISPHIARRLLRTPDHRLVLPISALCGSILLMCSDTLSRVLLGVDAVQVGIVTAFLGAPFFCYQLRRR